ncbi:MAG: pyridoxine 5'-phosphate synthase [Elusimicrobium sp.]|uniref:Pyridoxine 5'-phosphate synthase n=1 Tax=Candidatus Avelusimicrobium gallicola TaxID=2562704 RepID=A0A928DQ89_9BACT|nr:pyridoxine 5'-phosphate synthase [Elusimicrobium sp.]
MSLKLGVNIDHVATLRQARRTPYPDPVDAASLCLSTGADYIVVHLRKDARHINEKDVSRLCKTFPGKIHLECSYTPELEKAALKHKPFSVCIVPEEPGEVTTTGGLKFTPKVTKRLMQMIENLHKKKILVSLFVSPVAADIRTAAKLGADIVELCTRDYSEATTSKKAQKCLQDLALSTLLANELGLEVHAGHGLDYHNVLAVADIGGMTCMNIGFSIITRSLFAGLPTAVSEMKGLL